MSTRFELATLKMRRHILFDPHLISAMFLEPANTKSASGSRRLSQLRTSRSTMKECRPRKITESLPANAVHRYHLIPSAINRIPTKGVVATHPVNDGNKIPTRSGDLNTTSTWRGHLRLAYQYDYGKPAQYPSLFESRPIQWSRKFGFTDKYVPDHQIHTPESPPLPPFHHQDT